MEVISKGPARHGHPQPCSLGLLNHPHSLVSLEIYNINSHDFQNRKDPKNNRPATRKVHSSILCPLSSSPCSPGMIPALLQRPLPAHSLRTLSLPADVSLYVTPPESQKVPTTKLTNNSAPSPPGTSNPATGTAQSISCMAARLRCSRPARVPRARI